MSESWTYPWAMVMIGQDPYVKIRDAEEGYDTAMREARLQSARAGMFEIHLDAHKAAASSLAARAVFAEAKVAELERERDALREDRDGWKRSFIDQERSYRQLWVEFWLRQGFDVKRVRRALEDTFHLKPDQTEWVNGTRGCYTFDVDWNSSHDRKKWGVDP